MNIRIFFVRKYEEYFHEKTSLPYSEIALNEYLKAVKEQQSVLNPYFKDTHEGKLYGKTEIDGLNIDFNFGLRLDVPEGNFHVKISDFDSELIFFDEAVSNTRLISSEGYYVHWHVEVFRDGELIFEHLFNPAGQRIFVFSRSAAMGDNLALLPYVREFQKKYDCEIFLWIMPNLRGIVAKLYPEFNLTENLTYDYYATFYTMAFMGKISPFPVDGRTISLDRLGGIIFGLKIRPQLPKFIPENPREIKEPYVCISVQGSQTKKSWLYPGGWDIITKYLKSLGYRVLCIDKNSEQSGNGYTVKKPNLAEDFTGEISLVERADMLYYAEFFIGIGSGLSWLANATGCPVVLIGGFSQDWYEFYTPYRIANRFVCNGCFNNVFEDFFSDSVCPRYEKTSRELECQKKISPRQVINSIEKLILDKNLPIPVFQKET